MNNLLSKLMVPYVQKGNDGRPQRVGTARRVDNHVGNDGRPQGSPPPPSSTPAPTIDGLFACFARFSRNTRNTRTVQESCIVGAGDEEMGGGNPCGRPSFLQRLYGTKTSPCVRTLAVALLTVALISNVIFLFLLSSSASAQTAATGNGRIYGQLLDSTKNNAPLAGQTVTLQVAQLGNGSDLTTATTDAHGNYNFSKLSTDKTLNYAVYIHYQNAQYVSNIVTLDSKPVQQVNLTVYDATPNSSKLAIVDSTILLHEPDTQKGMITVSEFFDFENLDRYTYVGSLDASKGKPNALLFSLPTGARNVVLSQGFGGYNVIQVDRGFASNVALLPGTSQLAFSFDVPYNSTSYDFSYTAFYPTVSVSMLVPPDLQANSALLTSAGLITSNNQPYHVFKGGNLLANQGFRVSLNGLHLPATANVPQFNTGLIWLVVAVLLMCAIILVTAFVYRWQNARTGRNAQSKAKQHQKQADKHERVEKHEHSERKSGGRAHNEQEALLKELLTLDKSHEAGKLTKAEYQARRSKIKARLRELMREQETAHR